MSDSEEENFCFYGKALEPYDEESFPKKKPISVEEQIATDEQGRRRFHGAFTGGFSAGFFNTVGSLEGWRPSEFISSRSEKAEKKVWKPEDYMDQEDTGEFGIAPQTVKATNDYSTSKKRKKQVFSDGPIPGEPVLHTLISSGNETVGYLLMKNMSLKHRVEEEGPKTYGCEMPKTYEIKRNTEDETSLVPDIYLHYLKDPKINTFGLGHVGLVKSNTSLYKPMQLVVRDKNKKFSIAGQAFGVGAFEDDDEDIYTKDDMAKYDFELTAEAKNKKKEQAVNSDSIFEIFQHSKVKLLQAEKFPLPIIPHSFSGKHNIKKSRFEPLPEPEKSKPRRDINAAVRAKYLGETMETPPDKPSTSQVIQEPDVLSKDFVKTEPENDTEIYSLASGLLFGKFVSASQKENLHDILETVERSETEHGTQEMRDAAKLNMFGPLTRVVSDWKPCSLLCKRFNVPEPTFDLPKKDTKKRNPIIFEYQKNITEATLEPGLLKTKPDEVQAQAENTIKETLVNEDVQELEPPKPDESKTPVLESAEKEEEIPLPIDQTEKINVSKNIDLFRAVFLSSSESESEDEKEKEEETQIRNDLIKTTVLSDQLIPKIKTKQGILSNIGHAFNPLFKKQNANASSETNKNEDSVEITETEGDKNIEEEESKLKNIVEKAEESNLYGPKLPERIQPVQKLFVLPKTTDSKEKWVEKDAVDRKKTHKHKKKHKKEKHHKKEHKSVCRK